ncbi:MAG: hypothetical protein HYV97_18465 [Bdellovibrio sp.]|nr:hypothetical protein [Bdellovibrio sp.]
MKYILFLCICLLLAACSKKSGQGQAAAENSSESSIPISRVDITIVQSPLKQTLAESTSDVRWIRYKITDSQARTVALSVQYSLNGSTFMTATPKNIAGHDGIENIATSSSGVVHYFAWDMFTDLGSTNRENVTLRMEAVIDATTHGQISDVTGYDFLDRKTRIHRVEKYLVFYGILNSSTIAAIKSGGYQMLIIDLNPDSSYLHTYDNLEELKKGSSLTDASDDLMILGYIAATEDPRTKLLTDVQALAIPAANSGDPHFKFKDGGGANSGPSRDPRGATAAGNQTTLASITDYDGIQEGLGYKTYYLYDNYTNLGATANPPHAYPITANRADRNAQWGGFFVNPGDPNWFSDYKQTTLAEHDTANNVYGVAGLDEIYSYFTGNGFHLDGFYVDVLDTVSPNGWSNAAADNPVQFEWCAKGTMLNYFGSGGIRGNYPSAMVIANRGLFFYYPELYGHYGLQIGQYLDGILFESFYSDNSNAALANQTYADGNKWQGMPLVMAESQRHGFKVFSLGYVNGGSATPAGPNYKNHELLLGPFDYDRYENSGPASLQSDWDIFKLEFAEIRQAGFGHYVSTIYLDTVNSFVTDALAVLYPAIAAPSFNTTAYWHKSDDSEAPYMNRAGLQYVLAGDGQVTVFWDVATGPKAPVTYQLIYGTESTLTSGTTTVNLNHTNLGNDSYNHILGGNTQKGFMSFPFAYTVSGLTNGTLYYFAVRAKGSDGQLDSNQSAGMVILRGTPNATPSASFNNMEITGEDASWAGLVSNYSGFYNPAADIPDPNTATLFNNIKISNSDHYLFIHLTTQNALTLDNDFFVFIDTDGNLTNGYAYKGIGAEFMLQAGSLYQNTAPGWNWNGLGAIQSWQAGNQKTTILALDRVKLGNPSNLSLLISHAGVDQYGIDTSQMYHESVPRASKLDYTFATYTEGQRTPTVDGTVEASWASSKGYLLDPASDSACSSDFATLNMMNDGTWLYLLVQGSIKAAIDNDFFLFIDEDNNQASGYDAATYGAEFMIQGTTLYQYTGSGADWSWNALDSSNRQISSNGSSTIEIAVKFSAISAVAGNTVAARVVCSNGSSDYMDRYSFASE